DLTGIPPENVPRYQRPNDFLCEGRRDIGASTPNCSNSGRSLLVGEQIKWSIFSIVDFPSHDGDATPANPTFSSAADAVGGHPSITAAQEPGTSAPFKKQVLDQATLQGKSGLWCLRWEGVDKANFVFMQFNREVGTTPKPSITIRTFCDNVVENCALDMGEEPVPTNGGVVKLDYVEVECIPDAQGIYQPVPGGVKGSLETGTDGVWGPYQFRPACYLVTVDPSETLLTSPSCNTPFLVDASLNPQAANTKDCNELEIGFLCDGMICGRVYCENGTDCTYDAGTDDNLPVGAVYDVTLTPVVNGVLDPMNAVTKTVDHTSPNYCFSAAFGEYEITIAPANTATVILTLKGSCVDKKRVTITSQNPNIPDCDFGYDCSSDLCGDVYCEDTGNCLYEAGLGDMPLPAGTQVTLTLTPILAGQPDLANVQTKVVTAPATRYCFEDLPFGEYTLTFAFTDGRPPMPLAPNCDSIKQITIDPATGDIDDCDFGFDCKGRVCGDAYCEIGQTPCKFDQGVDEPLPVGSSVILILSKLEIVNGLPVVTELDRETLVAPETRFCFGNLPYGDYQLAYVFAPASPVLPIKGGCLEVKPFTVSRDVQFVDD
ncbi:MAG: hypothetical protein P1V36_12895, partial [Planctomycetota bacterium]|nr:hypothetical protein [Planctomycetota bacterium]